MPKRKQRATNPLGQQPAATKSCLYLGCFRFDRPDDTDHEGSFQMVVEAATPEQAVERFRARLNHLRRKTTLFSEPTTIYLDGIIELRGSNAKGLLINYEEGPTPPEPCVRLMSMMPEQSDEGTGLYGWGEDPESSGSDEGVGVKPFVDYGGEAVRAARTLSNEARHARHANLGAVGMSSPSTQRRTERSSAERRSAAKARRAALAATVSELGKGNSVRSQPESTGQTTKGR